MNKSQRIKLDTGTTVTDKYIIVQLEQEVDTLEFMSMNVSVKDAYQDFNSDYGVLVGRVIANGGVGIPNAKISVFIPLSDEDALIGEIASIYPYKTPRDKNAEGKRYNLLPRVAQYNQVDGTYKPNQPFGSFPIKPEIVTNQPFLDVYKKYYKYTALTNNAGDYMIFGVPVGTQTVHLSVDITDIGKYSMTPAAMVTNLGYSPNLFYENNTKIKPSNDLGDLPNIETQEISVDIIPFWGDVDNFIIGITRQDFRIRAVLTNTFTIFGSVFTDGSDSMWGTHRSYNGKSGEYIRELFAARNNETLGIYSKRIGIVSEKIYYYPNTTSDYNIALQDPGEDPTLMSVLSATEYSSYKREGDFAFIVSCNRDKIVTDEFGNETPVSNDSPNGVFTKFKGFMTLELSPEVLPMDFTGTLSTSGDRTKLTPFRYKLKFPQYGGKNGSFKPESTDFIGNSGSRNWRKIHFTFEAGKIYSVSRFHGVTENLQYDNDTQWTLGGLSGYGYFSPDNVNNEYYKYTMFNAGTIVTNTYSADGITYPNADYDFPSNGVASSPWTNQFGANWMNFSVHLPQMSYLSDGYTYSDLAGVATNDNFHSQEKNDRDYNKYFNVNNNQPIAAGETNTKWFARSDLHWTDFIEVPKTDITKINEKITSKGFTKNDLLNVTLTGTKYRNGVYTPIGWNDPCPVNGGKVQGNPINSEDTNTYFYKGFGDANCIEWVTKLGLI